MFTRSRSLETPVVKTLPDIVVERNPTGDIVDPKADEPPTPSSPGPGSHYPGAGPHGLPIDGYGWRHHPSHKRCTAFPIDHNELNAQERCAPSGLISHFWNSDLVLRAHPQPACLANP